MLSWRTDSTWEYYWKGALVSCNTWRASGVTHHASKTCWEWKLKKWFNPLNPKPVFLQCFMERYSAYQAVSLWWMGLGLKRLKC